MRAALLIAALSVFLVAFGFRNDPDAVLQAIESGEFGRRAGAIETIVRRGSPELHALLPPLILDEDPRIREMAMDAASALGLEEAVAPLFEILRSGDEAERIRAVKALAAIDSPSARDALSRALLDPVTEIRVAVLSNARVQAELIAPAASALDDVDASVRALAARALGESGEQSALLSLLGKLGDPSVDVRVAVARALGELGAEESIPALGGALEDPEGHVREAAAISLSKIGGEVARQLLLRFIDRERGPGKRSAIVALAAFEKNAPIERLMREVHHEEFRETLYRAIESLTSDDSLRRRVTDSLLVELERANTQAALVGTVEALSNALDAGPVPELAPRLIDTLESIDAPRSGLIRALGKSGGEEALLALLVELDQLRQRASSQWERRVSSPELFDALRAIRDRGDLDYRAVDPLLDALPHLEPEDAAAALELLAPYRPTSLRSSLIANLERSSHPAVRRASVEALSHYDDADAFERLYALLDDRDAGVRAAAAHGLGKRAPLSWLPRFIERFGRPERTDRHQTLRLIAALLERGALESAPPIKRARITDSLYQIVQGRRRRFASGAIHALTVSRDAGATEHLYAALSGRDASLRAQILRGLRNKRGERTRAIVLEILQSEETALVQAAGLFALGALGQRSDRRLVEHALSHGPLRAREAASHALIEFAERGILSAEDAARICERGATASPLAEINLFLLSERLGVRCSRFEAPEAVLERAHRGRSSDRPNELMRFAAGALLIERLQQLPESSSPARAAQREKVMAVLRRCARSEIVPSIARLCKSAERGYGEARGAHFGERGHVEIRAARDTKGSMMGAHLHDWVVIVQFADGRLLPAQTDPRGELFLQLVPSGMVRLLDPASVRPLP